MVPRHRDRGYAQGREHRLARLSFLPTTSSEKTHRQDHPERSLARRTGDTWLIEDFWQQ
jgi:hypothetical protein